MTEVRIVVNPELGWDSVVGVFNADSCSKEHLQDVFGDECIILYTRTVEKDAEGHRNE